MLHRALPLLALGPSRLNPVQIFLKDAKMLFANSFVVSRWFALDAGYFFRRQRHYRLRGLYPAERVAVDEHRHEQPPKGANVLKIIRQLGPGRHEEQAVEYLDKTAITTALDTDAAIAAAFDLLSAEDVIDVRQATALAQARQTGRLQ
jgi:hypothetical protein